MWGHDLVNGWIQELGHEVGLELSLNEHGVCSLEYGSLVREFGESLGDLVLGDLGEI